MSRYFKKASIPRLCVFLCLLTAGYSLYFVDALQAEDNIQKNFTYIRPDDMHQIENLHERAAQLIEKKDFRGAINAYSEILLIEPDDDGAYANMGQAYMVVGDFQRAENAFQNALHINPENEVAAICLQRITDPDFTPDVEILHTTPSSLPSTPAPTETKKILAVPIPETPKKLLAEIKQKPLASPKPAAVSPSKKTTPIVSKPSTNFAKPAPAPKANLSKIQAPITAPLPTKTQVSGSQNPTSKVAPPSSSGNIDFLLDSTLSFNQWSQIALKNAGLYNGPIDGKIEGDAIKAIEAFQQKNGLEINGLVGPSTWFRLKKFITKNPIAKN